MTRPVMTLQVSDVQALNPLVRSLRLQAADAAVLPGFSAGAHLQVQVTLPDGSQAWRHYSLISSEGDCSAPDSYRIAVRLEAEGRGGSRFMHTLQPGATLTVQAPKNDFPLLPGTPALLVAGGIGITPLLTMAAQQRRSGQRTRMVYAGRSRTLLAFVPELQQLLGDTLQVHADDEAGAPLDVAALLDGCATDDTVYVCGPKPLLDAVLAAAQARGWPRERVHFELFTEAVAEGDDQAFELVLAQSGRTLTVAADQTIVECLEAAGCDPMFDCKRGECGVCTTTVLEGDIDHRDYVLSDSEKAGGKVMQICVSRARGPRLVLDL